MKLLALCLVSALVALAISVVLNLNFAGSFFCGMACMYTADAFFGED